MTTVNETQGTDREQLSTADFATAATDKTVRPVDDRAADNGRAVAERAGDDRAAGEREVTQVGRQRFAADTPQAERQGFERDAAQVQRQDFERGEAAPVDRQPVDRTDTERREALFPGTESQGFQGRWSEIQASFVDEPRRSVEQADGLVAEVMQRMAQVFADERGRLEKQWDRGDDTDTEALRQALRRYRSFFDRLLAM